MPVFLNLFLTVLPFKTVPYIAYSAATYKFLTLNCIQNGMQSLTGFCKTLFAGSNNFKAIQPHLVTHLINSLGVKLGSIVFSFLSFLCFGLVILYFVWNYIFILCMACKGNKKSLDGARERGINLRQQILELYRDYYHGGLMKLVVIGGGESFHFLLKFITFYHYF
jgi:hypothetical protein